MKAKVLYTYYENDIRIDVYAPRAPRASEVTWPAGKMRGSLFNSGTKAETLKKEGYRPYGTR
jgi:hypothetical protein